MSRVVANLDTFSNIASIIFKLFQKMEKLRYDRIPKTAKNY